MSRLNKSRLRCGLAALLLAASTLGAAAQPAPAPRAVVSASEAPEAMGAMFATLAPGETPITVEGAQWLQLRFADFDLGAGGTLTIAAPDGESQTFTQGQLEQWQGLSAVFNGSALTVTLTPGEQAPGQPAPAAASIAEVVIGLPAGGARGAEPAIPESIRRLLGDDPGRFIPDDTQGAVPSEAPQTRAQCGPNDDRVASNHPLIGRIMPIGCTGWLVNGGEFLTAGHCIPQVPRPSSSTCRPPRPTAPPSPRRCATSIRSIAGSIVSANTGVGNDWAIFRVAPNTETGLMPRAVQGGAFSSRTRSIPEPSGSPATASMVGAAGTRRSRPIPAPAPSIRRAAPTRRGCATPRTPRAATRAAR